VADKPSEQGDETLLILGYIRFGQNSKQSYHPESMVEENWGWELKLVRRHTKMTVSSAGDTTLIHRLAPCTHQPPSGSLPDGVRGIALNYALNSRS
jgi:hypothetical protein